MQYRINFGNGQVSNTYECYKAVRAELRAQAGDPHAASFRIQQYAGAGEWCGLGPAGRLATDGRNGIKP